MDLRIACTLSQVESLGRSTQRLLLCSRGFGASAGSPAKSDHKQAKRALDTKRQREDWLGRPIEDDLEI